MPPRDPLLSPHPTPAAVFILEIIFPFTITLIALSAASLVVCACTPESCLRYVRALLPSRFKHARSRAASPAPSSPPTMSDDEGPSKAPPDVAAIEADETASYHSEQTGDAYAASLLALARRVRALGVHLGDAVVSGVSLGLPNGLSGRPVFDASNADALMRGENLIGPLPDAALQKQLARNVVQVVKGKDGARERRPITAVGDLIQLASTVAGFDLAREYQVDPRVVETLDTTYALAVAAGLEALADAGLVSPPNAPGAAEGVGVTATDGRKRAGGGSHGGWQLRREHRDETGVIFAASFPALDSLVDELARAMAAALADQRGAAKAVLAAAVAGCAPGAARDDAERWLAEQEPASPPLSPSGRSASTPPSHRRAHSAPPVGSRLAGRPAVRFELPASVKGSASAASSSAAVGTYEFNRKLLFRLLVMANSQLAELIQARGPNLHVNAACAGTTAAIVLAKDWLRVGRCRRVVVISADNPTSGHLMSLIGTGFLALGAATTKPTVDEAALPFDKRRNGMILGAGAVGLVLETDEAAAERRRRPLATVLGAVAANSAFHASAIGTKHASELLHKLLAHVEVVHGLNRHDLASKLLYVSHETFTCARNGGCAGAEVTALKAAFGDDLRRILITNTKGMTGHPMGVCFEDVMAVLALNRQEAPPLANFRTADPALEAIAGGKLRLSAGGAHDAQYALHFAAGFGSQVAYVLYKRA